MAKEVSRGRTGGKKHIIKIAGQTASASGRLSPEPVVRRSANLFNLTKLLSLMNTHTCILSTHLEIRPAAAKSAKPPDSPFDSAAKRALSARFRPPRPACVRQFSSSPFDTWRKYSRALIPGGGNSFKTPGSGFFQRTRK